MTTQVWRKQSFSRLVRALALVWKSAPRETTLSTSLIVLQAVLPLLGLYLFKLIVDTVVAGAAAGPGAEAMLARLVWLIGLATLVAVIAVVARALAAYAAEAQSLRVSDFMLDRLNQKAVEVDYAYYEDPRYFNTLHRAQQDAPVRPTRLLSNLTQVTQNAITSAGILVLLATVHLVLATIVVLAVFPALALRIRHSRRLHQWQKERAGIERQVGYLGWILGTATYAKEMRVFQLGGVIRERFQELRERLRRGRLKLSKARNTSDALTQIGAAIVVFGSYAFIAYQTLEGVLTVGDLVMYFGAVQRGQTALQTLFSGLAALYEDNLFLSNVDEFFELEPTIREPADPVPVPRPLRDGLSCEEVHFQYPASSGFALQGVSLRVRPGEIVALVGPNGSGKTTLLKLLCRLYDPTMGSIRMDGIELSRFRPSELRRQIAVLFQDYGRYYLSAADNIWFGDVRTPASPGRIREAASLAGVDEAIGRLTYGYDTILGKLFPNGEELSVGEWQKIALARAFLSPAEVLLVDEPTSALDGHAEAEVVQALRRLVHDRAVVVVSHRLSTVRLASRIYCMDRGRIVEEGDHDELMARGGLYAKLFRTQVEMYTGDVPAEGIAIPENFPELLAMSPVTPQDREELL